MSVILGPLSDDNAYFMNGGVSTRMPKGDTVWRPERESQPESWTCGYCGTLNAPDTWECSRCPAPRREATREEESIWQPPMRAVSHVEEEFYSEPTPSPSPESPKTPVPTWLALLVIFQWLLSVVSGLGTFVAVLLGGSLLSIVLLVVAFTLCFWAFNGLRRMVRSRYNLGTSD